MNRVQSSRSTSVSMENADQVLVRQKSAEVASTDRRRLCVSNTQTQGKMFFFLRNPFSSLCSFVSRWQVTRIPKHNICLFCLIYADTYSTQTFRPIVLGLLAHLSWPRARPLGQHRPVVSGTLVLPMPRG